MPHTPQRALELDNDYHVVLRVPGWLKNVIIDLAAENGSSVNQWLLSAIHQATLEQRSIPAPPQARAPLPTTVDQIRAYAEGEKLTLPCGRQGDSCDGTLNPQPLGTHLYCPTCHIRVE